MIPPSEIPQVLKQLGAEVNFNSTKRAFVSSNILQTKTTEEDTETEDYPTDSTNPTLYCPRVSRIGRGLPPLEETQVFQTTNKIIANTTS